MGRVFLLMVTAGPSCLLALAVLGSPAAGLSPYVWEDRFFTLSLTGDL